MWSIFIIASIVSSVVFVNSQDLLKLDCETNSDCSKLVSNTFSACVSKVCVCYIGNLTESVDCEPKPNLEQRKSNLINGPCPCDVKNAGCINNECVCNVNFTVSKDKKRCLKNTVKLGEECEINSQCFLFDPFGVCTENKCDCSRKFININNRCRSIISLPSFCTKDEECMSHSDNSTCIKPSCVCDIDFVSHSNKDRCLPSSQYGEKCMETSQCVMGYGIGALCEEEFCTCNQYFYNVTMPDYSIKCDKQIAVGQKCSEDEDCRLVNLNDSEQTMECISKQCNCRRGFEEKDQLCYKRNSAGGITLNNLALLFTLFLAYLCST